MSKKEQQEVKIENKFAILDDFGENDPEEKGDDPPRKRRRLDKKAKKRVEKGSASKKDYLDVYGKDAKAVIELKLQEASKKFIRMKDVQDLMQWVLGGDVISPKWAFVKNKPLINKVVLLILDSLDIPCLEAHASLLPALSKFGTPVETSTEGWGAFRPFSYLEALFQVAVKERKAEVKKVIPVHRPPPPMQPPAFLMSATTSTQPPVPPQQQPEEPKETEKETTEKPSEETLPSLGKRTRELEEGEVESPQTKEEETLVSPEILALTHPPVHHYILTTMELVENNYVVVEDGTDLPTGFVRMEAKEKSSIATTTTTCHMVAIDCEMCYTDDGLELTRVTVVDESLSVLYDTLVLPEKPIRDYNTKFSGITAEMMAECKTTLEQVQQELGRYMHSETIIIGHSLENDLRALKIVHDRVIDTAILYPHPRGAPFKNSLKHLAKVFLGLSIRENPEKGHDSVEDAATVMQLVKLKVEKGIEFGRQRSENTEHLLTVLRRCGKTSVVLDTPEIGRSYFASSSAGMLPCKDDQETCDKACSEVTKDRDLVVAHFHTLRNWYTDSLKGTQTKTLEEELGTLNALVQRLIDASPLNTAFFVVSGQGNPVPFQKLQNKKLEQMRKREPFSEGEERELQKAQDLARKGVSYFAIN